MFKPKKPFYHVRVHNTLPPSKQTEYIASIQKYVTEKFPEAKWIVTDGAIEINSLPQ